MKHRDATRKPLAMVQPALLALGKPGVILRTNLRLVPVQLGAIAAGASVSLLGAAIGFAGTQCLALVLWARAARRELGIDWTPFFDALRRSALLAGVVSAAPLLAMVVVPHLGLGKLVLLLTTAAMGVLLFVLAAHWLRHPIDEEVQRVLLRFR